MELQRSIGLEEWCSEGKRESGRQHLSLTNRAFLGGQVKYRVPLKVPSVHPTHSSSWDGGGRQVNSNIDLILQNPIPITKHYFMCVSE